MFARIQERLTTAIKIILNMPILINKIGIEYPRLSSKSGIVLGVLNIFYTRYLGKSVTILNQKNELKRYRNVYWVSSCLDS